jgi:hypothetical protein
MAKQSEIPGTERTINKKVAAAGEQLADLIKDLTEARNAKNDGELTLINVMKAEKVPRYVHEEAGIEIILSNKDKVRIKKWKRPESDNAEPVRPKARA